MLRSDFFKYRVNNCFKQIRFKQLYTKYNVRDTNDHTFKNNLIIPNIKHIIVLYQSNLI